MNVLRTEIDIIQILKRIGYSLGFRSGSATFGRFRFGLWFWFSMCPWFGTTAAAATAARATATPDTNKNIAMYV